MKKIVIVVAVLLLATPAMGKVTAGVVVDVNASLTGNITMEGEAEVAITYNANAKLRAFALDLTVDANATVSGAVDFHTGESTESSRGFGIFPASFNRFIDADDPNWSEPNYTSVADVNDLPSDTQPGLGTGGITIEMGSLYVDDNSPPLSGTLANIYVACWDPCEGQDGECDFGIAANVGRGKVVLEDGNEPNNLNFPGGNPGRHIKLPFDFGDAPDNAGVPVYPTLLVNNGARHVRANKPAIYYLGPLPLNANSIDAEPDGQPSAGADDDDKTGPSPDDGDGVILLKPTRPTGTVTVLASAAGVLNAWMDFNIDGDWKDAGEQIFTNRTLVAGPNPLTFAVPPTATHEVLTYSRWRFSTHQNLKPTGAAPNGEVEDYNTAVVCHVPDVVGDTNAIAQAAITNAGFTVNIVAECNDTIAAGFVIRTDPAYCNYPGCGTTVDIYVSTGPCVTVCLGDTDGDTYVAFSDVDHLVNDLIACGWFSWPGGPGWEAINDTDNDGYMAFSDVDYLVNYLIANGWFIICP